MSFITVWMGIALLYGCGYHFKADGRAVGLSIESIAIPLMTSTSSEAGFEADFTDMVREEFIQHASIPLRPEAEAHMVLTGKIVWVATEPLTSDRQTMTVDGHPATYRTTSSRRLRLKMEASLKEKSNGTVIWENTELEAKADFPVTTDPLQNRTYQQQALREIARQLARRMYQQTMERF